MNEILRKLYANFTPEERPDSPEWKENYAEYHRLSEQVVQSLGLDFLDRFLFLKDSLDGEWEFLTFQEGFRLGASLMLEVFRSA